MDRSEGSLEEVSATTAEPTAPGNGQLHGARSRDSGGVHSRTINFRTRVLIAQLRTHPRRHVFASVALASVTFVLCCGFIAVDLAYNRGRYVAPLDDVYIHLQYAKQLGDGHFLQFNTGDPISTGASSLLYVLIIGGVHALGMSTSLLLPAAVVFGVACLVGTVVCTYALGRRVAGTPVAAGAAGLVALNGALLWGATSGMEVGFVALLVVASLLAFTREAATGRFVLTVVVATLLVLTRPEGMVFAFALCGAMCWTIIARTRARMITPGVGILRIAVSLLPLVAGAAQLLFYRLATGSSAANGIHAKSLLYFHPLFYPTEFVDETLRNLRRFSEILGGLNTQDYTFPGAIFFFVLGVFYLVVTRPAWRGLVVAMSLGFTAVLLALSTLITAHAQNLRYTQPFLPVFLLLVVAGVYGLTRVVADGRLRRFALFGLLTTALLFSVCVVPIWALRLGRDSASIRDTDVSIGHWIRGELPANANVGVKDVGAIAYFGERRVVDIIGLATNKMAEASNNGAGTLYERLRHMPLNQRPDYFAIYDPVVGPPIGDLQDAGVLGTSPLSTFHTRTPLHPTEGRVVPFDQVGLYQADWSLSGTGDHPQDPPAGVIRDYLNVGDLDHERSHSYEAVPAHVGFQPMSLLRRSTAPDGKQIIDSARHIVGGERFQVRNLVPGQPLVITSRIEPAGPQELRVSVNGIPAGTWSVPQEEGEVWQESHFTVPGHLVTGPDVRVEISSRTPFLNPHPEFNSFGYWFSQH